MNKSILNKLTGKHLVSLVKLHHEVFQYCIILFSCILPWAQEEILFYVPKVSHMNSFPDFAMLTFICTFGVTVLCTLSI